MSARQFKGLLVQINNTGRKLDQLIARGIAYCTAQHVMHGNKNPWQQLIDAAPVFARKIIRDAKKAAESTDKADEEAITAIEGEAVEALEERRTKGAQRQADKAEETKHGKVREFKLIGGDEPLALTEEEYNAALAAVEALRADKADKMAKVQKLEDMQHRKTGTK